MERVVNGEVLWFNPAKGYGAILPEDGETEDIKFETASLVNKDAIKGDMRGHKVSVVFTEQPIGLVAEKVTILRAVTDTEAAADIDRRKLLEFVKRIPKVELFVHLEGTVLPSSLFAIAQRNNHPLGVPSAFEHFEKQSTFTDFRRFIEAYSNWSSVLEKSEDYTQITYEYLQAASKENIQYVEAYFSPYCRTLSFKQIFEGILAGRERASKEFGIQAVFVVIVGRHLLLQDGEGAEHVRAECLKLVDQAASYEKQGIVGFALGGEEKGYSVSPFSSVFEHARQKGLHTKAYSGEDTGPNDIWQVIRELKAERIGNPICAREDASLVEYMAQNQIPMEICLAGNVQKGAIRVIPDHPFKYHPLKVYLDQGIPVVLGCNNPALFNSTLAKEYEFAVEHFGFSADDIEGLVLKSIDVSWLADSNKEALRASFVKEIKQVRRELDL